MKQPKSIWGKQARSGKSLLHFTDLIGCRAVVDTVADLASVAKDTQKTFSVVRKRNNYLENKGYNAINYLFEHNGVLFEFQLKTSMNNIEAALSHDLIYAKEKAIAQLSNEEKRLVGLVIDVSTQLSMRDWSEAFQIPVRMASQARSSLRENVIRLAYTKPELRASLLPLLEAQEIK